MRSATTTIRNGTLNIDVRIYRNAEDNATRAPLLPLPLATHCTGGSRSLEESLAAWERLRCFSSSVLRNLLINEKARLKSVNIYTSPVKSSSSFSREDVVKSHRLNTIIMQKDMPPSCRPCLRYERTWGGERGWCVLSYPMLSLEYFAGENYRQ